MSETSVSINVDHDTPKKAKLDDDTSNVAGNATPALKSPPLSVSKRQQRDAEKAERLRLKEEKERQKTEEKERKEKEKNDMKVKKEAEKREKEEKRKQKEEEKKQKEEERKQREEEKKQKEEEKRLRQEQMEEEKRKKEEMKLEEKKKREEMKRMEEEKIEKKTQKEKALMKSFFIKTTKDASAPVQQVKASVDFFMPFELKPCMKLAPVTRYDATDIERRRASLESAMVEQDCTKCYLEELKGGRRKVGKSLKTWPLEEDVVVIPDESLPSDPERRRRRMKLLQFHDNYRPAYYGTWGKVSRAISGRRPLAMDSRALDYEFDSDEEWEEEEPGESISHSEGEDDGDEADGNDDNFDKFMVPHGYLSDGEGCDNDEELSPEALRERRQMKVQNWEMELKKNVHKVVPISIGVVRYHHLLERGGGGGGGDQDDDQLEFLKKFAAQPINCEFPIALREAADEEVKAAFDKRKKPQSVPEEAMPDLIKLVHGCGHSLDKMIKEFKKFWLEKSSDRDEPENSVISKRQLDSKIREIAAYKKDPQLHAHRLWYVESEVLEKYGLSEIPIPSAWKWSSAPSSRSLVSVERPANDTPKKGKTIIEMKTPKMSGSPMTPGNPGAARHNPATSGSIKKFMTPACEAVSSAESAKRRVEVKTLVRSSGSVFTPGENAVANGSIFRARRTARKRSSSGEIQSESKRLKSDLPLPKESSSSQDCIIVDGTERVAVGESAKRKSCHVKLFRCNEETTSKKREEEEEKGPVVVEIEASDPADENDPGTPGAATPSRNKTLTSFFKTLAPINK